MAPRGRPVSINAPVTKYTPVFIQSVRDIFTRDYVAHLEDEFPSWPDNTRYTAEFLANQRACMVRRYGNKKIEKYSRDYLEFLAKTYCTESFRG